jgi:hypothetical protein
LLADREVLMPLPEHTIENMYGDFKIGMVILTMKEFYDLWPECSEEQIEEMTTMLKKELKIKDE